METYEIIINSYDEIEPFVMGKVFHITPGYNTEKILKCGKIINNKDKQYKSPLNTGVGSGYFRDRGYISLFDYRYPESPEFKDNVSSCGLHSFIKHKPHTASVFILKQSEYTKLLTLEGIKEKEGWPIGQIVAHVEVGYPDSIDLSLIEKHIIFKMSDKFIEDEQ